MMGKVFSFVTLVLVTGAFGILFFEVTSTLLLPLFLAMVSERFWNYCIGNFWHWVSKTEKSSYGRRHNRGAGPKCFGTMLSEAE